MTEAETRNLLDRFDAIGGLEAWIAGQRWQAAPCGWTVASELRGWRFQLARVPGGLQITASLPGGSPAVWVVPGLMASAASWG